MREFLFWFTAIGTAVVTAANLWMLCKEDEEDEEDEEEDDV